MPTPVTAKSQYDENQSTCEKTKKNLDISKTEHFEKAIKTI